MKSTEKESPQDNYELVVRHDQARFLQRDPAEMAENTHLAIVDGGIVVPHFDRVYRVDIKTAAITQAENAEAPIGVQRRMMILHHLLEAKKGAVAAGEYVTMHSLKDVAIHTTAFHNRAVFPLAKRFRGDIEAFIRAGEALGAAPAQGGDYAMLLQAFPTIPIKYVFWDGDDEVPASVSVLFDRNITDFTHPEDVIGLGEHGADALIAMADGAPLF